MKIGISYSFFDCEELLKRSVEVMRQCGVDHISVIWQKISYFGQPVAPGVEELLLDLQHSGLVDELLLYTPKYSGKPAFSLYTTKFAKMDEVAKRNLGLSRARKAKCTHFLTIDADEFYFPEEFKRAAKFIDENNIDYSAIEIQPYHLRPTHALMSKNDNLRVPFLSNIQKWPDTWFEFDSQSFPQTCYTDVTRRINMNQENHRMHIFPGDVIKMHHMRTVRKCLCRKYVNSTHFQSANARRVKRLLRQAKEMQGVFSGEIREVENYFDINVAPVENFEYKKPHRTWETPILWCLHFVRSKIFQPLNRAVYQ